MKPKLEADGKLNLFGQRLTAQELDELLKDLAEQRQFMRPEVPTEITEAMNDDRISTQADPYGFVARDAGGLINIAFRHAGFGWMAFVLPEEAADQIRHNLANLIARRQGRAGTKDVAEADSTQH
jgi:hypothetical protein